VENSEKVEIVTRDRNQPAVILKTVLQTRFLDYEMDFHTGVLLFKAPIASRDFDLNPISIRVTYETDQGGPNFWVTGVTGKWRVSSAFQLGATWANDENPQDSFGIYSANLVWKLGEHTSLFSEWAHTHRLSLGSGQGERIELRHDSQRLQARIFTGRTDTTFDNPAATLNNGRKETGAKATYTLDQQTRLIGEALRTEDSSTSGHREGFSAMLQRRMPHNLLVEFGVRHATETLAPAQPTSVGATPVDFTSLRGKLLAQIPNFPSLSLFGEYEQDISDSSKARLSLGGEYQIANRGRIYARQELISSLSGSYALNDTQDQHTLVVGIDTDYIKDGHFFSEYRINDAITGREAEAAIGLRNRWTLTRGVIANTSFERVHNLDGDISNTESTAVTGAIEYLRNPNWKGTARLEFRNGATTDSILGTLGFAQKLTSTWTILGKLLLSTTKDQTAISGKRIEDHFRLGAAYRPVADDRWNSLPEYEFKQIRDNMTLNNQEDRQVHALSASLNFQPNPRLLYTARYAIKLVNDPGNGNNWAQLLNGRVWYELDKRWEISLLAGILSGNSFAQRQYGAGVEAGRQLGNNLWLSAGYNILGYHDDDLSGENYTDRGPYLRLRLKLDENLLMPNTPSPTQSK
jgi:hypothetical protein